MFELVEFYIAGLVKHEGAAYHVVCNTGGQHLYVCTAKCASISDASDRIEDIRKNPQYKDLKFLNNWATYTAGEVGGLDEFIYFNSWGNKVMNLLVDRHSSKVYNFKPKPAVDLKPPADADRSDVSLADKYPKYYKRIPEDWKVIDVYGVHHLFPIINDDSGCIRHSSKKLLLPGVRTGGKSFYKEIVEARDTLDRWLELNKELLNE